MRVRRYAGIVFVSLVAVWGCSETLPRMAPQVIKADGQTFLACCGYVISQIGTSYYWASRENVQLVRIESGGAFITLLARNGAGT